MEIIDKYIQGSKVTALFSSPIGSNYVKIGIDNATNYEVNHSKGEHDVCLEQVETNANCDAVEITIPDDFLALVVITIYVPTIISGDDVHTVMFLNEHMLFKAQEQYLNTKMECCGECDEKQWRVNTLAILLRMRLLEYAYDNNLIDDAISYHEDLIRTLSFDNIPFYNPLNINE